MNSLKEIVFLPMVFVFCMAISVFAGDADMVAQENGVLENTQVALLLLSGLVFVVQSFRVERNFRFILWMGAWFCLSVILRELDVEDLAVPQWVIAIGSGTGRNLILGVGWIALGVIAIKSYSELKGSFGRIARSRTAILVFSAGILLLLGSLFDHKTVVAEQGVLWEEILETIGYFLLIPAAFCSKSITKAFN